MAKAAMTQAAEYMNKENDGGYSELKSQHTNLA